ncbi:MAG: FAD-binding protein [Kordiimonadaceae bacterium]|nr:FAD-binding protein [Kordiimonadaceae bacterium]
MTDLYFPTTEEQVSECICDHIVMEKSLDVRTGGSLISLGSPMNVASTLSLKELNQVKLYEPEELVITLEPGVLLSDLKNLLMEHNQELKFEPPDLGPLLGNDPGIGTIGGIIGTNLSGPKRFLAGGARDYILGVQGISGFGQIFKAGGRVVKNVSGYDVSKLMCGSYGTLGAITEMTLKLAPKAQDEISLKIHDLETETAIFLMTEIAACPYEVSGLAHIPGTGTFIRIEGTTASLDERIAAIRGLVGKRKVSELKREESEDQWRQIRDVAPLNPPKNLPLWKISIAASDVLDVINDHNPEFYFLDWAGGLLWMSSKDIPTFDKGAFWLIRNTETPLDLPFNKSPDPLIRNLNKRIKKAFDPKNILNPGRLGF